MQAKNLPDMPPDMHTFARDAKSKDDRGRVFSAQTRTEQINQRGGNFSKSHGRRAESRLEGRLSHNQEAEVGVVEIVTSLQKNSGRSKRHICEPGICGAARRD
ncbi:unnamed protein product [Ectocarpus sp. 12 AP-2014]